jgi:phosphoglycolate phosphatase-like HAD superfamily hydrolase
MLSKKQHIVFDLDGTIMASTPFYLAILERIFAGQGLSLDDATKREAMGLSARAFLEPRMTSLELSRSLDLLRLQSEIDLEVIPLFDGMKNLLRGLFRRGVRMAVWTSRDARSAKALLQKHGLDALFEVLVTADCVTRHKPDPEGLHYVSRQWACPIEELVMIGDHDVDMIAARSAGALPIRANWHGFSPGFQCDVGAMTIHRVDTLAEVFHA